MNILKRFINWIREYRTEEARQTRLFNKERRGQMPGTHTPEGCRAHVAKFSELCRKFPKSKQATGLKRDYDRQRPHGVSPETWEARWQKHYQ